MASPKIILGIPGIWTNREDFKEAMARKGNGYLYMGNHIGNLDKPDHLYEVDISEHNPYIAEAIEISGYGLINKDDIERLKTHSSIIYLIGEGGSFDKILNIMDVASAVLNVGGIAVNVESSGRSRSKEDWLEISKSKDISKIFSAFIQMSQEGSTFYTTGMQCFGLRDVITSAENITAREVATLFKVFCLYNLDEKTKINDGETFSLDPSSPIYLIEQEKCTMFEEDDPYFNLYGVWNMIRHHHPKR
ncbi:DUF4261 domain-containing protein [Paenibacillus glacialis]|uniref:DUF4261 domain-containing protein n=1 Tax=Paenibacillus glacialis TaxID=494026 RepID=A0A168N8E8_9BACL|nr:DUF4261 domain-containing protein [Paenibacillus glacialis]OAB45515.1 hypothetical protein PGLA_04495 [Paenibacillus glacialis]